MASTGVADGVIERAARLSAATLHEAAGRVGALPAALKPLDPQMRLCGRALPIHGPAGDNLWLHRALACAGPGDVMIFRVQGEEFGYWGEVMATSALARGVAGLVITGGVRDSLRLIELGLPTFSTSLCIRGTIKDPAAAGGIGSPIEVGDVTVCAGDLVFGDADGIVVLSPDVAEAAVIEGERRDAREVQIMDQLRAGATTLAVYNL